MNNQFKWRMNCALALVVSAIAAHSSHGEFETPTALTNVKIVTGTGTTIDNGTIVMLEGRIVAVGTDASIPPHAERIDGSGLIAYPGFIDAHTNLGIPEKERTVEERIRTEDFNPDPREGPLPATRFAERRGIRPHIHAIEQYAADEKVRESHRAVGFTTALIAPRDGLFGGSSDLVGLSNDPIRRSVMTSNVAQHGSFTVGEPGEYPRTILGVFAQFRQVLLDARRHSKLQKYYERHPTNAVRPPTDAALDALQPMLGRSQRIFFEANTDNEIRRALDLAAEFKLDVAITGAKEAWEAVDRLKAERVPLIVSLKFEEEPDYGKKKPKGEEKKPKPEALKPGEPLPPAPQPEAPKPDAPKPDPSKPDPTKLDAKAPETADVPPEVKERSEAKEPKKDEKEETIYEPLKLRKERRRLWEEQVANVIRLHEAGVPFAFTTRPFKKASEFMDSLRIVVEKGLPEEAALKALTANPAEILGMKAQLGALAPGYVANVTVLTKPLSDKGAKTKFVFIDGKKIDIDAEDEKDKEKGEKEKKGDRPDGEKPAEAGVAEVSPDDAKDKGPTWPVEIKADRVPKTKTGGSVLVQNATILPVSGPTIPNGSILIRNGKIAALGSDVTAPPGVTVIDATGRYVMPGIVDCHSHLGIDGVNEGSLAISAEVRIADTIDPHDVSIYRAAAGGATTHHAMHGSANPIGGQNVIFKLKYERPVSEMVIADAPRTIKFALGENVTQANFFENFGKRYPITRMGVEAVIRTAFEAAKDYQGEWDDYNRQSQGGQDLPPPRKDLRLEALADVLSGKLTVHSHCYRSEEILRLLATAEEYGIRIGTLHHVLEGYRIAPELARHGCGASSFANDWAYKVEAYGAIPHNAALMTRYGVNSSVNSDSANTIRYLNQEAAKCIKWGGLDENQALRLVTLNPAMQLQVADRVGSLEVGKDGDLAIYNGHPLSTFSKCVMTLIDGEVFFEDSRPDSVERTDWKAGPSTIDRAIPKTAHRAYAIVGATIHPISGPVIEKGTVVIVEDKVLEVGENVQAPPGAGVIEGAGLHVYPGLIDASSIIGLTEVDSLRSTRDFNEIGTFNPHIKTASAVHPHSEHVRIARTAGITTAVAKPSGGRIFGQSSVIHLDGWTAPEMLVVDAFGLHMSVPSLPVQLPEDKEEKKKRTDEHKKALKQLEDFVTKAKHYAEVKKLAESDARIHYDVDLSLEAMIPYVRGEKPVVLEAGTYKAILDALEFADKHKFKCVLLGGQEAWKVADMLKEKNIPVILATVLSYPRGEYETWDSVYRCAAELDRVGVKFCFGSDSASSAFDLGTIAGMAVAHGLPRERAEFGLTLGAAEILGVADRLGSIEPGKRADLIVTTDTPLQTVAHVTHMFIDGRPINLSSMQTESYEKFKNRPSPKLPPATDLRGPKSLTAK